MRMGICSSKYDEKAYTVFFEFVTIADTKWQILPIKEEHVAGLREKLATKIIEVATDLLELAETRFTKRPNKHYHKKCVFYTASLFGGFNVLEKACEKSSNRDMNLRYLRLVKKFS